MVNESENQHGCHTIGRLTIRLCNPTNRKVKYESNEGISEITIKRDERQIYHSSISKFKHTTMKWMYIWEKFFVEIH